MNSLILLTTELKENWTISNKALQSIHRSRILKRMSEKQSSKTTSPSDSAKIFSTRNPAHFGHSILHKGTLFVIPCPLWSVQLIADFISLQRTKFFGQRPRVGGTFAVTSATLARRGTISFITRKMAVKLCERTYHTFPGIEDRPEAWCRGYTAVTSQKIGGNAGK